MFFVFAEFDFEDGAECTPAELLESCEVGGGDLVFEVEVLQERTCVGGHFFISGGLKFYVPPRFEYFIKLFKKIKNY